MSPEPGSAPLPDDELFSAVYGELKRLASSQLRRESQVTLCTTELVHETWVRLRRSGGWQHRGHFFGAAARAMRHILIDFARRRAAGVRAGARQIDVRETGTGVDMELHEILALETALVRLQELNPRLARIVELRFYGGLDVRGVAELLGVTTRTVERDWLKARLFLLSALEPAADPPVS